MKISFTDGSCGGCEFVIAVSEDEQKNTVQVDSNGNLVRDENGDVLCGKEYFQVSQTPQDRQNDTLNNEVWVALRKDDSTFGTLMPAGNLKPKACTKNDAGTYENDGDPFVITNIDLPLGYVTAAEERLEKEILNYMATNNSEKFTFLIKFSRIYLEENQTILNQLSENSTLVIRYNGINHSLYVSSFSYKMTSNEALPEITVELTDTITIIENAVQNAINAVKYDILSRVGNIDWLKVGLKYFLRKDINDATPHELGVGKLKVDKVIESANFMAGLLGNGFQLGYNKYDENGNGINTHLVVDTAEIRKRITFNSLEIKHVDHVGGEIVLSPAGATIERVEQGVIYETTLPFDGIVDANVRYYTTMTNTIEGIYWLSRYNIFAAKVGSVYYTQFFDINAGIKSTLYNAENGGANPHVNFLYDGEYYSFVGSNNSILPSRLVKNESSFYRCYFKKSDDTDTIVNEFAVGDLVKCQTFNLNLEKQRYYWRKVVAVDDDYIDLSINDCDPSVENDIPMSGDVIVTMGNSENTARQNVIVISSYGSYAPSITMYQDVHNYNLDESNVPVRISPTLGNKFTGDFYIQVGGEEGASTTTALAEFLKNRISLGVNHRLGGENAVEKTSLGSAPAIGLAGYRYGRTYAVNEDVARTWNVGDKIVFSFLFQPYTEDVTNLLISGNGVLSYMFDDLNLSSSIRTGINKIKGSLVCKRTLDEAIAEAEANDEEIEYGVLISAQGTHAQGELYFAQGYTAELKRTGIDIENGRITLDAQTTTIKDGNKEIAVFTTDDNGKAILSTELIDADKLSVNKLTTKGTPTENGKVKYINIAQSQFEAYDTNGELKIKIHSGNVEANSSANNQVIPYKKIDSSLAASATSIMIDVTNNFEVTNELMSYQFANLVGQVKIVLEQNPSYNQLDSFPEGKASVWLYYGNTIETMGPYERLGYKEFKWESDDEEVTLSINFPIATRTFAKGFYRIVFTFSTSDAHTNNSKISLDAIDYGIRGIVTSNLQEIAADGYHYGYSQNQMPKYQKCNQSGFEVVFGSFGFKVNVDGVFVMKNNTWNRL